MIYSLTNICTKNLWNRTIVAKITVVVGWHTFLRHNVHVEVKSNDLIAMKCRKNIQKLKTTNLSRNYQLRLSVVCLIYKYSVTTPLSTMCCILLFYFKI